MTRHKHIRRIYPKGLFSLVFTLAMLAPGCDGPSNLETPAKPLTETPPSPTAAAPIAPQGHPRNRFSQSRLAAHRNNGSSPDNDALCSTRQDRRRSSDRHRTGHANPDPSPRPNCHPRNPLDRLRRAQSFWRPRRSMARARASLARRPRSRPRSRRLCRALALGPPTRGATHHHRRQSGQHPHQSAACGVFKTSTKTGKALFTSPCFETPSKPCPNRPSIIF